MKITILGAGNMGGAIACGLAADPDFKDEIVVINRSKEKAEKIKHEKIKSVASDYSSLAFSDIIIIGVKPWMIESVLTEHKDKFKSNQIIISIAAGISLNDLSGWLPKGVAVFRLIPNTAIAVKESMTFFSSMNATNDQNQIVSDIFNRLGKVLMIEEKLFPAVTALSSCGIAYAFRYIRAAMEGGVEMGINPTQSRDIVIQTLRGAIELLEANQSHPEAEIDKVTTPGGITIKGLNEMEHAGFSSAVIKGLKASNVGK